MQLKSLNVLFVGLKNSCSNLKLLLLLKREARGNFSIKNCKCQNGNSIEAPNRTHRPQ